MTTKQDERTGGPPSAAAGGPLPHRKGAIFVTWITSTDHKIIGYLYLITSCIFFGFAGLLAIGMRIQLSRPGLAFLGIYTFVSAWNDYIWPLIVLVNPNRITLQVALAQLNTAHGADYSMIMAGALMALLPVVVVFVLFARQFMAGAVKGALRG